MVQDHNPTFPISIVCRYSTRYNIPVKFSIRHTRNMSLEIPSGTSIVEVFLISPNQVLDVPATEFLTPDIPGTTYEDTPCLSFLIQHIDASGNCSRALFDLGIRSDWNKLPPTGELCSLASSLVRFFLLIGSSRHSYPVNGHTDPHRS